MVIVKNDLEGKKDEEDTNILYQNLANQSGNLNRCFKRILKGKPEEITGTRKIEK